MKCKLVGGMAFLKGKKLFPAGSVVDLDEDDRKALGEYAEPVEPEAKKAPEKEPAEKGKGKDAKKK